MYTFCPLFLLLRFDTEYTVNIYYILHSHISLNFLLGIISIIAFNLFFFNLILIYLLTSYIFSSVDLAVEKVN